MKFFIYISVVFSLMACSSEPTDATLEKNFHSKKDKFNLLVQMSNQDKNLAEISRNSALKVNRIKNSPPIEHPTELELPLERWNAYRKLFDELGIDGLTRWILTEDNCIFFNAYTRGAFLRGIYKGYVHCEKPVDRVSCLQNEIDTDIKCKKLEKYWYISRITS